MQARPRFDIKRFHDAVLLQNLGRFDANRDGRLSEAEYRLAEATLERERIAVTVADDALIAAVRAGLFAVSRTYAKGTAVPASVLPRVRGQFHARVRGSVRRVRRKPLPPRGSRRRERLFGGGGIELPA
jgi:hypothetical protein